MKSICEITLYDLMAEDHEVWLRNDKHFGFIIELENEKGEVLTEEMVHPFAVEGFADFCRGYLSAYEHATKEST